MIDAHLPSLDRLPQHRELLERAFAYFRDDIRIVGLVVGGSLARGGVDFYSDLDLYVVVRDVAFEDVFTEDVHPRMVELPPRASGPCSRMTDLVR